MTFTDIDILTKDYSDNFAKISICCEDMFNSIFSGNLTPSLYYHRCSNDKSKQQYHIDSFFLHLKNNMTKIQYCPFCNARININDYRNPKK
jgi:hypothetical protein